jgi:hypothetical protein
MTLIIEGVEAHMRAILTAAAAAGNAEPVKAITLSGRLSEELKTWAEDERAAWQEGTET